MRQLSDMILKFDLSDYTICLLRLLSLTLLDYGIMLRNAKCLELIVEHVIDYMSLK